jgi:hypothetical protein
MLPEADKLDVLNVIQAVLRGIVICLAMHRKEDMWKLSAALAAFASNPNLDKRAEAMLIDIAQGVGVIAGAGKPVS